MAAGDPLRRRRRRRRGAVLGVLVVAAVAGVLVWQERAASDRLSGPSPTWRAEPTSSAPGTSGATSSAPRASWTTSSAPGTSGATSSAPRASGATSGVPAGDDAKARYDTARRQLATLAVRGWDRTSDFQRYQFGPAWSDDVNVEFGHNGCNTRDDILRRDLTDLVVRPFTCFAQRGSLVDPYTGTTIEFVRGPQTSNSIEIDHVVSLADAWYKGARAWDPQRRLDFANDPRNLLAVSPQANFDKAFRDASSWLPPNEAFRCDFVARQIDVKAAYGLWLSAKERAALADVLARC